MDLSRLKVAPTLRAVTIISGMILPIVWFLYDFYPGLFFRLDVSKLLLLSAGIGAPLLMASSFLASTIILIAYPESGKEKVTPDHAYNMLLYGSLLNYAFLVAPSVIMYYIGPLRNYTPETEAQIYAALIFVVLVILAGMNRQITKKPNKKEAPKKQ